MIFSVDTEVCTQCGQCVRECPTGLVVMGESGPEAGRGSCLRCGHCVSVCPTKAIDYDVTPRVGQEAVVAGDMLTPEAAEKFMRYRRSIRNFKPQPVSQEDVRRILNVARMAPTATNSQGVSYIVIRNKERLQAIADTVLEWMTEVGKKDARMRIYSRGAKTMKERGMDFVLRDAPTLVLAVVSAKQFERGRDNSHFCLSYAELFAPTLGVGSCWTGFVEACAQHDYAPLLELIGIEEGKRVGGSIIMGYPAVRYQNYVERDDLDVSFDE